MSSITKQHLRFYIAGLGLSLFYGVYQSIPIMFYRPQQLMCRDATGTLFECTEDDFCSGTYERKINMDQSGIMSLSMEYLFYCNDNVKELYIIAITNAARTFGYLVNWLYMAQPKNYLYILCFNHLITGLANLAAAVWSDQLQYIVYAQIVWSFNYTTCYTYAYAYGSFFAPEENKETSTTFYNLTQPVGGLIYLLFAMYFPSWRDTVGIYAGIFQIANGVLLFLLRFKKDEYDAVPESFNDGMNFKDCLRILQQNPDYWSNLKIWTWIAVAVNMGFIAGQISLGGFGGDIFLNMMLSSFLEVIAGSSAHYVVGKVNLFKFTRNILIFMGLSYITMDTINTLSDSPVAQKSVLMIVVALWPIVWGKIAFLSLGSMFYKILDEMFPTNLGTFSCSWIQFFSQVWMFITPFYDYLMRDILGIKNKFLGYGIIFLSAAWISTRMVRVCQENIVPMRDIELKEIQTPPKRLSMDQATDSGDGSEYAPGAPHDRGSRHAAGTKDVTPNGDAPHKTPSNANIVHEESASPQNGATDRQPLLGAANNADTSSAALNEGARTSRRNITAETDFDNSYDGGGGAGSSTNLKQGY